MSAEKEVQITVRADETGTTYTTKNPIVATPRKSDTLNGSPNTTRKTSKNVDSSFPSSPRRSSAMSTLKEVGEINTGLEYTMKGRSYVDKRVSQESNNSAENVQVFYVSLEFKDLQLEHDYQRQYGAKNVSNARITTFALSVLILASLARPCKYLK
jgi:hypothetical protein